MLSMFFAFFQDDLDLPVKIKAGHIGKTFKFNAYQMCIKSIFSSVK